MTRIWRSCLAGLVLAAGTLAVPAYGPAAAVAGVPPVTRLSSDPFTNATSQHATEVEPGSFAWGSTIVDAVQAVRFATGGASDIGWATSADGGATWAHGFLSGLTVHRGGGSYPRATDPVVSYDARHKTWLIAATALVFVAGREPPGIGVAVLRSASGTAWTKPVFAIGGTSDASITRPMGTSAATRCPASPSTRRARSTSPGRTAGSGPAARRTTSSFPRPRTRPPGPPRRGFPSTR